MSHRSIWGEQARHRALQCKGPEAGVLWHVGEQNGVAEDEGGERSG